MAHKKQKGASLLESALLKSVKGEKGLITGRIARAAFVSRKVEGAYPVGNFITDSGVVGFHAAARHDRFADTFGGSGAVIINHAATAGSCIIYEVAIADKRGGFAGFCFVEYACAVGSCVALEGTACDLRCASAGGAIIENSASVQVRLIIDEFAVRDAGAASAVVGVVVNRTAFKGNMAAEDTVGDGGVRSSLSAVVVPSGATSLRHAFVCRTHSRPAFDNETIDDGCCAGFFGINNGVAIVVFVIRVSDLTAQDGRVLLNVALFEGSFRSVEAAIQSNAVGDDKGNVAVVVGGRRIDTSCNPDLIAGFSLQRSFLQTAHCSFPGCSVSMFALHNKDDLRIHLAKSQY